MDSTNKSIIRGEEGFFTRGAAREGNFLECAGVQSRVADPG